MTRALIVGGSGQDGSYLAERLLAEGFEVHTLSRASDPSPGPDVISHRGDVTEIEDTRRLLLDLRPDEVYNLAAISSVAMSWEQPELVARVNGLAAVALLESARQVHQAGTPIRFIQASSAEIFGDPRDTPQTEDTPLKPINPYGAAKAYAHLAVGVQRANGLHASSLILYNHESPRRLERFVTRKITAGVAAIARGEAEVLTLGNLDARRDWGWAPDYVDAMVRAARAEQPDDYVIATGEAHSVREFAETAFRAAGIDDAETRLRSDPAFTRPTDASLLVGDSTKARENLGWAPTKRFEDVVAAMVAAELTRSL